MKKVKKLKSLTAEQERKIMSYPSYFQKPLRESALMGEDIEITGEQLIKDWSAFT